MPTKKSTASAKTVQDEGEVPVDLINYKTAATLLGTNQTRVRQLARSNEFGPVYLNKMDKRARLVSQSAVELFKRRSIQMLPEKDQP